MRAYAGFRAGDDAERSGLCRRRRQRRIAGGVHPRQRRGFDAVGRATGTSPQDAAGGGGRSAGDGQFSAGGEWRLLAESECGGGRRGAVVDRIEALRPGRPQLRRRGRGDVCGGASGESRGGDLRRFRRQRPGDVAADAEVRRCPSRRPDESDADVVRADAEAVVAGGAGSRVRDGGKVEGRRIRRRARKTGRLRRESGRQRVSRTEVRDRRRGYRVARIVPSAVPGSPRDQAHRNWPLVDARQAGRIQCRAGPVPRANAVRERFIRRLRR